MIIKTFEQGWGPAYWQKKFLDLYEKIMYNKLHFAEYIQNQQTIINKVI